MQLDRQQSVRHPDQLKEELICDFCVDIAVDPVRCQGKCQTVYCRKCATEWCQQHRGNASCPRKCMNKWKISLIPKRPIEMACPYNEECIITFAEDLQRHIIECPHQPIDQLLNHQKKTRFLCDREHRLTFLEKMPQDITDPICMDCSATENVKSICYQCGTMYCNKCRIPQYTQRGCPANHKYKSEVTENLRCNICNLTAAYVSLPTHQDTQCKFNICELCFRRLPRASEEDLLQCMKGHKLFRLPEIVHKMCYRCEQVTSCWKECERCGEYACLRCERDEFRVMCDSPPSEILFETRKCNFCAKLSAIVFCDRENELVACYSCINNPRKKAPLFCDNKHILTYVKNKFLHEACSGCDSLRRCRLVCKQCDPEVMYCTNCKPANLLRSCYLGHPYKGDVGTILRECLLCRQYRKTIDCTQCNFSICDPCRSIKPKLPEVVPAKESIEQQREIRLQALKRIMERLGSNEPPQEP